MVNLSDVDDADVTFSGLSAYKLSRFSVISHCFARTTLSKTFIDQWMT